MAKKKRKKKRRSLTNIAKVQRLTPKQLAAFYQRYPDEWEAAYPGLGAMLSNPARDTIEEMVRRSKGFSIFSPPREWERQFGGK